MLTPGDFFGGFMATVAAGFIVWRIRFRFKHDQRWSLDYCPRCSSPIVRVHRKLMDRILGATLLPEARRYRWQESLATVVRTPYALSA